MPKFEPIEIVQRLIVIVFLSLLTSWSWLIWRLLTGHPILPEQPLVRRRAVPWHFGTILLVLFLYLCVSYFITLGYSIIAGPALAKAQPVPLSRIMVVNGLVTVILLMLIPWVAGRTSGASLIDFGLSLENWWPQVVYGVIATLIAAPPIYAIQFGAQMIWKSNEHPLSKMMTDEFSASIGWLAVVTAVVLAPMFEELLFRSLLQGWLAALVDRRSRAVHKPFVAQEIADSRSTEQAPTAGNWDAEAEPGTLAAPDSPRPTAVPWIAIILTSLLFAYVHAPQWPAPIALFVLALVIGTMYHLTGSLITAVCMHATFNGMSTLMLFAAVLSGQKMDPDKVADTTDGRPPYQSRISSIPARVGVAREHPL